MMLSLLLLAGCREELPSGPSTASATCQLTIGAPDEAGVPSFSLSWDAAAGAPGSVHASVAFFGAIEPGVVLLAEYAADALSGDVITLSIPLLPAERTDGQLLQEHFRDSDGALTASVTVDAAWDSGLSCSDTRTVPFRSWDQLDAGCDQGCGQPDTLALPTDFTFDGLDASVAESMAHLVVTSVYSRAAPGTDNFTLTQLPLTGTPLRFTRLNDERLDPLDTEQRLSVSQVLNCARWQDGRQLILTEGYPGLTQAVSVLLDSDDSILGFSYSQEGQDDLPSAQQSWLHHNCFLDPRATGDTVPLYGLSWSADNREGRWVSDVVRVDVDFTDGAFVGEVEPLVDIAALTTAGRPFGNVLTLSPPGSDGIQWIGASFANDHQTSSEPERAFFLSMPLADDSVPRFLFVNASQFDPESLSDGWQETFPELEVVALPDDPVTGFYPIDFPHNIEFFLVEAGAERGGKTWDRYRLIIASLGAELTGN
ncbi:MAG: hypothetical protein ACI8RZ_006488, partial [Myxococcota bacterium]